MRAPPMPPLVTLALAAELIARREYEAAFLVLISFGCFLLTGEMLSLVYDDIVIWPDFGGVVSLGHTKSGKRHAAYEASTIFDPLVGKAFEKLSSIRDRHGSGQDFIFSGNFGSF